MDLSEEFSLNIRASAFLLRFEFETIAISLSALITADLILGEFDSSLLGSNDSPQKVSNCVFSTSIGAKLTLSRYWFKLSFLSVIKGRKKTVGTFVSYLSFQ